jgi:TATA-binding protein-associated factor
MGRMSDPVPEVRDLATRSFAALVPLLPLARGAASPAGLSAAQRWGGAGCQYQNPC